MSRFRIGGPPPVREEPRRPPIFTYEIPGSSHGDLDGLVYALNTSKVITFSTSAHGGSRLDSHGEPKWSRTEQPGSLVPIINLLEGICPLCASQLTPAVRFWGDDHKTGEWISDYEPMAPVEEHPWAAAQGHMIAEGFYERGWAACPVSDHLFRVGVDLDAEFYVMDVAVSGRYRIDQIAKNLEYANAKPDQLWTSAWGYTQFELADLWQQAHGDTRPMRDILKRWGCAALQPTT